MSLTLVSSGFKPTDFAWRAFMTAALQGNQREDSLIRVAAQMYGDNSVTILPSEGPTLQQLAAKGKRHFSAMYGVSDEFELGMAESVLKRAGLSFAKPVAKVA